MVETKHQSNKIQKLENNRTGANQIVKILSIPPALPVEYE